ETAPRPPLVQWLRRPRREARGCRSSDEPEPTPKAPRGSRQACLLQLARLALERGSPQRRRWRLEERPRRRARPRPSLGCCPRCALQRDRFVEGRRAWLPRRTFELERIRRGLESRRGARDGSTASSVFARGANRQPRLAERPRGPAPQNDAAWRALAPTRRRRPPK